MRTYSGVVLAAARTRQDGHFVLVEVADAGGVHAAVLPPAARVIAVTSIHYNARLIVLFTVTVSVYCSLLDAFPGE